MVLESLDTVAPHHKPDFDASESSSQCQLPVPVIDDGPGICLFGAEEGRSRVQSEVQSFPIPDEEERCLSAEEAAKRQRRTAVESDQSPFVHVGAERCGVAIDIV